MKIRERLVVAFLIIITIPIISFGAAAGAILNHQMNAIEQSYDVETNTIQILINPVQIYNRLTQGIFNRIQTQSSKNPGRFLNKDYLDGLNNELESKYSYLVIKKGAEYTYIGDEVHFSALYSRLPSSSSDSSAVDGGYYINAKSPCLIKQLNFYFPDKAAGTAFIITDINTILPQLQSSFVQFITSFVAIMCITATLLILWIYQGIIRPLNTLRIATLQIQEGNLDYTVKAESEDEIGELCEEFDKMRRRLKKLIEDRLQYEEDSRELISNISHDLKTPLTAIKGYTEGIIDGVADTPEKREKYLKTIYTKATDMSVLVDELSFYSKIDMNSIPYNFIHVNLDSYFRDCISDLTLDLEVKQISLGYFNYVNKAEEILADAEQLKRVINNIVSNSVKYMDKDTGIINICIRDASNTLIEVSIEDNGKGISQDESKLIFDRFYRTDASRNSSKGGTGLGLAICRKIIEDHGGSIWATGALGTGTKIYFTLKKFAPQKEDLRLE